MPKLRVGADELDVAANEEAEYSDGDFESYDGLIPPGDTKLTAYVKSMWKTKDKNGKYMLKVLVVAADNVGEEAEYDGLPMWGNYSIIPKAKFKWAPFFDQFGITVLDAKNKTYTEDEEDEQFGWPITKIGTFKPGSEASWCRVITKLGHNQEGDPRAEVKNWLDYEEPEDLEDEAEPEDEDTEDEEYEEELEDTEDEEQEEDDEQEEEAEEEEEPVPPARGGRRTAAARPATARGAAKTAAAKPAAKGRTAPAEPTRQPAARRTAPARSASAKAAPAATRGKGRRAAAAQDEPPF